MDVLERLDAAAAARGVRRMLFARDGSGRAVAGTYLVWDGDCAFSLFGGHEPGTEPGAMRLLDWEAIRFASGVTRAFDFAGSMIEGVEHVLRGFGTTRLPYVRVTGLSRRMRPLWTLNRLRKRR